MKEINKLKFLVFPPPNLDLIENQQEEFRFYWMSHVNYSKISE